MVCIEQILDIKREPKTFEPADVHRASIERETSVEGSKGMNWDDDERAVIAIGGGIVQKSNCAEWSAVPRQSGPRSKSNRIIGSVERMDPGTGSCQLVIEPEHLVGVELDAEIVGAGR